MATRGSYNKKKNNFVSTKRTFKIIPRSGISPEINQSDNQTTLGSSQDTRPASSITHNGIKDQPSVKNFSSRNSLRTAQTFSNNKQQTITPFTMPNIANFNANDLLNLNRCVEPTDNYQTLSSETFLFCENEALICLLCGLRSKQQNYSNHLSSELHCIRYNDLRRSIVQQVPDDSSIQMNAVRELVNTWYLDQILSNEIILSRFNIVQEFELILNFVAQGSRCRLFGSMVTGTALKGSDINLELIHPNSHIFEEDPRSKNSLHHMLIDPNASIGSQINHHTMHYDLISNAIDALYKVMNAIKNRYQGSPTSSFAVLSDLNDLNAKVPKLVLLHENSRTKLQVCCYAESSHKLAVLLGTYLSFDARASILSVIVKHWAKICKIDNPDSGSFPSDVFIILVIYYLQRITPPILPCLHEIISKSSKIEARHDQVDGAFNNQFKKLNIKDNRHVNNTNFSNNAQPEMHDSNSTAEIISDHPLEMVDDGLEEEVDEVDEEEEDDDFISTDSEIIKNIDWTSSNETPVYKLFLNFLSFMAKEFDDIQNVISIRTLKVVNIKSKRFVSHQVKAIENPVRPRSNLSCCIGNPRIFVYIKQCFSQGYQYLTCLPLNSHFQPRTKRDQLNFNPCDYTDFYVKMSRIIFYFEMKKDSIGWKKNDDPIDEMIRQNLFARDVETINNLFDRIEEQPNDISRLPSTVTKFYDLNCLVPRDVGTTIFCWLCKAIGHTRESCYRSKVESLYEDLESYDKNLDIKANLDQHFLDLYQKDRITPQLSEVHKSIVDELETMINEATRLDCRLELFGSTVNNLGSSDSDLDICLTLNGNQTGNGVNCVDVLEKVYSVLIKEAQISLVEPILTARVPIIKFKYSQFDVDLSMYNQCAIYNSKLLKAYSIIDERVAQLFHLVKRYAKACKIADASRGSLSSYAWSLLVIHYLQRTNPPILPVLQEPPPGSPKPLIGVNGWNVWFSDQFKCAQEPLNQMTLTGLFKNLLIYYSTFQFNIHVVSIRKLDMITRFQKNWNNCAMAIEDPFELTYNLASRLDEPMALYIINSFALAFRNIVDFQINCPQIKNRKCYQILKLFNNRFITNSNPPYRGCRVCHRIGHRLKDCPERNRNNGSRTRTA